MSTTKRKKLAYKKNLGVYYTPITAARILCNWAIQNSSDNILEPSFGACGFLEACQERFVELKTKNPLNQLFGCDTDEKAFTEYLQPKFGILPSSNQFIKGDFLKIQPEDFNVSKFEAIVGNPPYVSYHNMSKEQRDTAIKTINDMGFNAPKISSLWLFFVFHSINFLKEGGRVAWVLPSSFIHADYANYLKTFIENNFQRSIAIQIGQRLFLDEGTDEVSIMLFAEGYKKATTEKLKIAYAPVLKNLKDLVNRWNANELIGVDFKKGALITKGSIELQSLLTKLKRKNKTKLLGEVADVRIGIVTGANKFFIINKETANQNKLLDKNLTYILSKSHYCKGLNLNDEDLEEMKKNNLRCFLVGSSDSKIEDVTLQKYLELFPEENKAKNKTFPKHTPWFNSNDKKNPDAFLSYMCKDGPNLIINDACVNCTNSIHRIYFKDKFSIHDIKMYSISLMSSFGQLSAEIEGRIYGSGVLKLEPSEAKKLHLLIPEIKSKTEITKTFSKINNHLRKGRKEKAIEIADNFIMKSISLVNQKMIKDSLIELRLKRKRK